MKLTSVSFGTLGRVVLIVNETAHVVELPLWEKGRLPILLEARDGSALFNSQHVMTRRPRQLKETLAEAAKLNCTMVLRVVKDPNPHVEVELALLDSYQSQWHTLWKEGLRFEMTSQDFLDWARSRRHYRYSSARGALLTAFGEILRSKGLPHANFTFGETADRYAAYLSTPDSWRRIPEWAMYLMRRLPSARQGEMTYPVDVVVSLLKEYLAR